MMIFCKHTQRIIFLLIFTFFVSLSTFAQRTADDNRFEFGLRIAPIISWTSSDSKTLEPGGNSLDWNYGLTLSKKINERYLWSTEINVAYINTKMKFTSVDYEKGSMSGSGFDVNLTYHQSYIEIPLLIKMRTNEIKDNMRIYGEFGLGNSFLFRNKADVDSKTSALNITNMDVDNPDASDKFTLKHSDNQQTASIQLNAYRMSMIIGAGAIFDINSTSHLYAGLRYNGAINDMMSDDVWTARYTYTALNLGFIF